MRLVGILAAVVVVVAASAGGRAAADARAMKPEARAHYERGLKLYERRQYDDAVVELRAGLAIDPQPELLYALGQAERRRGHCERAIEYYQSCLGLVKDPAAAAALRVQIERCKVTEGEPKEEPAQLPASPPAAASAPVSVVPAAAPPAAPAAAVVAPAAAVVAPAAPAPAAAPSARWSRDALGLSLGGIGIAGAAVGGALMGVAHARGAAAGGSYQAYADARSAPTWWTAGVVTLAVGGALVVAGVVRLAIVAARRHR